MAYITKSPWIIHYDGSSCNGCDIEVLACLTPMYDVERFGIINTGNPKHADIFLVTGSVNEQNAPVIKQIYEQMPRPKVVVAIGICANSGGVFKECYNVKGGVDTVIPVDVYVPGCAARPEAIIDGVVKGLGVLAEKRAQLPEILDAEFLERRKDEEKAEEARLAEEYAREQSVEDVFSVNAEPVVASLDPADDAVDNDAANGADSAANDSTAPTDKPTDDTAPAEKTEVTGKEEA